MNQEKITLTRNELKYIAESLAIQKVRKIMKSKSRLNEVLVNWDNDAPEDEGILSTDEISDKLKGTFWNGSSSEPIDDEIIDWSDSESSEDDEDSEYSSEPLEDEEDEIIDWSSSEPIDDEDEWSSE
jgi:hypothetical protein